MQTLVPSIVPLPAKSPSKQDLTQAEVPMELSTVTPGGEDEWELKFYDQVKQDSSVPAYFKTTLGILVANNQDLRKERAFLHNHLSRSRP
ncbi:hypothetical protein COOONC_15100 [Cooperia oncophora]